MIIQSSQTDATVEAHILYILLPAMLRDNATYWRWRGIIGEALGLKNARDRISRSRIVIHPTNLYLPPGILLENQKIACARSTCKCCMNVSVAGPLYGTVILFLRRSRQYWPHFLRYRSGMIGQSGTQSRRPNRRVYDGSRKRLQDSASHVSVSEI